MTKIMPERKITGEYIAGFVDGEGCFSLTLRKDKQKYFYWKASFVIVLRKDDQEVLEKIKTYFKSGNISKTGDSARYQISDTDNLINQIVPFFDKHTLIGKKKYDFLLWKKALFIIKKNKKSKINSQKGQKGFTTNIWDSRDLGELEKIREQMKEYKGGGTSRPFKHIG